MFDSDEKIMGVVEKAHNHGEELKNWLDTKDGKKAHEVLDNEYMQTLLVGFANVLQKNEEIGILMVMSGEGIRDDILGLCRLAFMFGAKSAK